MTERRWRRWRRWRTHLKAGLVREARPAATAVAAGLGQVARQDVVCHHADAQRPQWRGGHGGGGEGAGRRGKGRCVASSSAPTAPSAGRPVALARGGKRLLGGGRAGSGAKRREPVLRRFTRSDRSLGNAGADRAGVRPRLGTQRVVCGPEVRHARACADHGNVQVLPFFVHSTVDSPCTCTLARYELVCQSFIVGISQRSRPVASIPCNHCR